MEGITLQLLLIYAKNTSKQTIDVHLIGFLCILAIPN